MGLENLFRLFRLLLCVVTGLAFGSIAFAIASLLNIGGIGSGIAVGIIAGLIARVRMSD